MGIPIGLSGSYVGVAVLGGATAAELEAALDSWLDAHIATEILGLEFAATGAAFAATIVYRRERRVRHA